MTQNRNWTQRVRTDPVSLSTASVLLLVNEIFNYNTNCGEREVEQKISYNGTKEVIKSFIQKYRDLSQWPVSAISQTEEDAVK